MRMGHVQRKDAKELQHNGMDEQDEFCGQYHCNGIVVGSDHLLCVLSTNSLLLHGKNV